MTRSPGSPSLRRISEAERIILPRTWGRPRFNVWIKPSGVGEEPAGGIVNTGRKETGNWTHGVEDILLGFGFRTGRRDPRTRVRFPLGPLPLDHPDFFGS